ncbi:MAG: SCO family protein [Alphaproteobacteria bacterium]|nr:SCO family protein [Alphaproteobacteria bacterium]
MLKKTLLLWSGLFILGAVCLGFYLKSQMDLRLQKKVLLEQKASATIGGPFSLKDTKGNRVTSNHFQGKYLLVYFGYTFCPDICPTALDNMTEALSLLGSDAVKIQPLFITVDPKRDTESQLESYMKNFHPSFKALTGSEEDIKNAMTAYKVYASVVEGSTPEYLVDHSSIVYLMDPGGQFMTHFTHQTPGHEIAFKIRELLKLES